MKFSLPRFLQGSMIGAVIMITYCNVKLPIVPNACASQTASGSATFNTPSPTPTKTPPCDYRTNWDYNCGYPLPSISPTPTEEIATPSATPTPTSTPSGSTTSTGSTGSGGNNAPQAAVCEIPWQAPILQGFQAGQSGSVTFSWWGSPNVDKYSIIYGYAPNSLIYGEDNIPSSSTAITINNLQPGAHVWAIVSSWRGGCAEASNELDPLVP